MSYRGHPRRRALGSDEPLTGACARKKITIKHKDGSTTEFMGRTGKDCPPAKPTERQLAWRTAFGAIAGKAAKECKPVPVSAKGACLREAFAAARPAADVMRQEERDLLPRGHEDRQLPPGPASSADFTQDIPEAIARAAHRGTSFEPERRGQQEQEDYAAQLRADYAALARHADTPAKKALLEAEFARYREAFRLKTIGLLQSRSRVMSTMITGGSNFPTARNQKRLHAEDARREERAEFRKRALAAIHKVLTPEQQPIRTGDTDAGERLAAKIAELEKLQERMKAANAAIRSNAKRGAEAQVAALVALGFGDKMARALLKGDSFGRVGFAPYQLTNNAANIRRLQSRSRVVERNQATPAVDRESASGIRLEDSPAENRVRLFFPGKPSYEVRTDLKAHGFRWAPTQGAWSAYRNDRSIRFATQLVGGDAAPAPEAPAEAPQERKSAAVFGVWAAVYVPGLPMPIYEPAIEGLTLAHALSYARDHARVNQAGHFRVVQKGASFDEADFGTRPPGYQPPRGRGLAGDDSVTKTDPALWMRRRVFGVAGGPDEVVLTDEGNARAFAVGAQVRRGRTAEALEALWGLRGSGYLSTRNGTRLTRTELGRFDQLAWGYLRGLGFVSSFQDDHGDGVRLTDAGRRAAAAGIEERSRLLERCRRSAAAEED